MSISRRVKQSDQSDSTHEEFSRSQTGRTDRSDISCRTLHDPDKDQVLPMNSLSVCDRASRLVGRRKNVSPIFEAVGASCPWAATLSV